MLLDPGSPAVVRVIGKEDEGLLKERPRAGEVGRGAGAAEEDGGVVLKTCALDFGVKGEAGQSLPEVVRERLGCFGVVLLPQLLLGAEPVAVVLAGGLAAKAARKWAEEGSERRSRQGFLGEGVGDGGAGALVGVRVERSGRS